MKRLGLFIVSICLLFLACQESEEVLHTKGGIGTIYGEFPELSGQKILVHGDDYRSLTIDTIELDKNGLFTYKTYLDKPGYYSFQINRSKVLIYIKPFDSIAMSGNINNLPGSIKYSGSSVVYNNYLAGWIKAQLNFQSSISEVFGGPEELAVQILDSLKLKQMDELEQMSQNFSGMDAFFLDTEKARILYTWALNLQNYPRNHTYITKKYGFEVSPMFYNFLAELDINDSTLIHIPVYRKFLEEYIYLQMENAYKKDSLVMVGFGSYTGFQMYTLAQHISNQQIIDYLSYTSMKNHVHYDGVKDFESLFPYFDSLCHDSIFTSDILADLKPWSHLRKGEPSKDFTYVNIKGDSISLSDFRGKYVFIDVWATWCTPCLAEVPALLRLEKEMHGRNIVFLSISVDKDRKAWESMVHNTKLSGIQLYAGQSTILMEFYKITGIPRFMLIDPQGNIVEASADRPSMNIRQRLEELEGM